MRFFRFDADSSLWHYLSSVALFLLSGTLQPGTPYLLCPLTLGSLHYSLTNEEFSHLEVGGAEEILPSHRETEGPPDIPLVI